MTDMTTEMGAIDWRSLRPDDPTDWKALPPTVKLELVEAMGFSRVWTEHQPECPYAIDAGMRCNCIPPGTSFHPPHDVVKELHETYEELRQRPKSLRRIPPIERW